MTDRVQDFPTMIQAALGDRIADGVTSFIDMLAPDAVMEFPFAPPGLPTRLEGREGVADHLVRLAQLITFDRMGTATIVARDGGTTVLSFEASGRGIATGAPYEQRYLSMIETRDGHITRYVDYWDPLVVLRALSDDAIATDLDLGSMYHG